MQQARSLAATAGEIVQQYYKEQRERLLNSIARRHGKAILWFTFRAWFQERKHTRQQECLAELRVREREQGGLSSFEWVLHECHGDESVTDGLWRDLHSNSELPPAEDKDWSL